MDEHSNNKLGQVRREYSLDQLDESQLPSDPMVLFGAWMERARQSANPDPTAMTLSTVESKRDQEQIQGSRPLLLART